jgi:hypothetical protein
LIFCATGDSHTWELALDGAGGGPTTEEGASEWLTDVCTDDWSKGHAVWEEYATGRPGAAPTAALEAAGRLIERSNAVVDDIVKR